jgi:hypothetical protein
MFHGAHMKRISLTILPLMVISGCITVPSPSKNYEARCEISTDRLTLKIVDVAEETNSYYSISGIILTPILVPVTAIISGVYVVAHNTYNLGEEKIVCSET